MKLALGQPYELEWAYCYSGDSSERLVPLGARSSGGSAGLQPGDKHRP